MIMSELPDWNKVESCDLFETLAYKNAKLMFPTKNENLWLDVAALATVEKSFPEGYGCHILDLVDAINEKFKIDKPLRSSIWLRNHPFLDFGNESLYVSTRKWLADIATVSVLDIKCPVPEGKDSKFSTIFREAYGKEISWKKNLQGVLVGMGSSFEDACIANAQNKMLVIDLRHFSKADNIIYKYLKVFAKKFDLDIGTVMSKNTPVFESSIAHKCYIDMEEEEN